MTLRRRNDRETATYDANETLVRGFVKVTSTDETKVDQADAAGELVLGAIESVAVAGERVRIITRGECYLPAGATIAAGAKVQTDANGKPITAASGDSVCGRCLSGGDAGDFVTIDLQPGEETLA